VGFVCIASGFQPEGKQNATLINIVEIKESQEEERKSR